MNKERPILFSGQMVRAILDGRKTMTRRIVKLEDLRRNPDGDPWYKDHVWSWRVKRGGLWTDKTHEELLLRCPFGQPGDRLWVKETARVCSESVSIVRPEESWFSLEYLVGGQAPSRPGLLPKWFPSKTHNANGTRRWQSSIYMPRWASRITLEIVSIRVERLLDISEEAAHSEGIDLGGFRSSTEGIAGREHRIKFRELWESINGPGSWDANPWVWVVEFKRIEAKE